MNIYQPSEDSYFLTDILKKQLPLLLQINPNLTFLEIGAGSGIHLETAYNNGIKKENIYSSDINPNSVNHCSSLGFKCINSDLFENLKGKWDIIVFNPPYLPENEFDNLPDTSGGKKGDEITLKFLQQAKEHLNPNARIFLLLSSQTPMHRINQEFKNYHVSLLGNERLFYEELFVYELTL
jgi:release factor glutamine methyltransferase